MAFHRAYDEREAIATRQGLPLPPLPHSQFSQQRRTSQNLTSPVIVGHPHSPPYHVGGTQNSPYGPRDSQYNPPVLERYAYHHGPLPNHEAYTLHHSSPKYNHMTQNHGHPDDVHRRLYYQNSEHHEYAIDAHGRPYNYIDHPGPGPKEVHHYSIDERDRNGYPLPPRDVSYGWEQRRSDGMLPRSIGGHSAPPPPPNSYHSQNIRTSMHSMADPNMIHIGSPGDQRPTYVGYIKSAHDAILMLSACDLPSDTNSTRSPQQGKPVPPPRRVTRRLLDAERADMVASGCVFAWDEKEAGMKRWTDGRVWSASRVSGCFLTYRELEARKKSNGAAHDGPTSNQYKPEGLIKQSFSVTTASGRKLHVISYFTKRDVREGRLRRVSEDPRFVGEGGGEWGLKVNDDEYSFPDGTNRGVQPGMPDGQGDVDILDEDDEDEDNLDSPMPLSLQRPSNSNTEVDEKRSILTSAPTPQSTPDSFPINPRKRSLPDDVVALTSESRADRPPSRPKLQRLRSSSYSGSPSGNVSKSNSYQSGYSSSSASTVPSSDSLETLPGSKIINGSKIQNQQSTHPQVIVRSNAFRALVSPTLPRESAIRGSAHEMQPTDSQDSANAVGALLSLAGGAKKPKGFSSLGLSNPNTSPNPNGNISGLGLSVKGAPERRESDRNALNMFSIRL